MSRELEIRYPKSRTQKLGLAAGAKVALLGVEDPAFQKECLELTRDLVVDRPAKGRDLVFFAVGEQADLLRLADLRAWIADDGAIWALWRKGRKELREGHVREAALAVGLVDVKVAAFSETLSGLKLVIPVAQRKTGARSRRPKAPPIVADDLAAALARSKAARAAFDRLPPSHQREHIATIDEAKRPETRARRIARTIQSLASR